MTSSIDNNSAISCSDSSKTLILPTSMVIVVFYS
jgi:hypothetical protein